MVKRHILYRIYNILDIINKVLFQISKIYVRLISTGKLILSSQSPKLVRKEYETPFPHSGYFFVFSIPYHMDHMISKSKIEHSNVNVIGGSMAHGL